MNLVALVLPLIIQSGIAKSEVPSLGGTSEVRQLVQEINVPAGFGPQTLTISAFNPAMGSLLSVGVLSADMTCNVIYRGEAIGGPTCYDYGFSENFPDSTQNWSQLDIAVESSNRMLMSHRFMIPDMSFCTGEPDGVYDWAGTGGYTAAFGFNEATNGTTFRAGKQFSDFYGTGTMNLKLTRSGHVVWGALGGSAAEWHTISNGINHFTVVFNYLAN